MMRLPTKKRLLEAKEKPEKPEFSRLFGHGADAFEEYCVTRRVGRRVANGISARGGLSRQTVHRTVGSCGQIALQFSPYFKSHHPYKTKRTYPGARPLCLVRMTGFEPTRLSTLEPDGNDTLVEDYFNSSRVPSSWIKMTVNEFEYLPLYACLAFFKILIMLSHSFLYLFFTFLKPIISIYDCSPNISVRQSHRASVFPP